MAAPKTRNLDRTRKRAQAVRPASPGRRAGGGRDADKAPVLAKTDSRDPNVLGLELTIVADRDEHRRRVVWKAANFHKVVTDDQFAGSRCAGKAR